jgi:hypothetical protein
MAMRRGHDRGAVSDEEFRHVVRAASEYYNVQDLDPVGDFEFHAATAPVFHPGGELACTLPIWGPPPGAIPHSSMMSKIDHLVAAAQAATEDLASRS